MLKFVPIESKKRIDVMLGVIRLAELTPEIDGAWIFSWFNNHELLRFDDMRQIADKLYELNRKPVNQSNDNISSDGKCGQNPCLGSGK